MNRREQRDAILDRRRNRFAHELRTKKVRIGAERVEKEPTLADYRSDAERRLQDVPSVPDEK